MKRIKRVFFLIMITISGLVQGQIKSVLVEAESFDQTGGWVVDQQFIGQIGSSYLMAHGMGVPVTDAVTEVKFPRAGEYQVFVRTFNWTSPWFKGEGPGKFQLLVDGNIADNILGTKGSTWIWQDAGKVIIHGKTARVFLHDLTGFDGRCDAIYFTTGTTPPPDDLVSLSKFRKKMLKIPAKPISAGRYDLVVVGGGMAGICAAISAARLGLKVALIQDRPVLGGNNSSEVRVLLGGQINIGPYPKLGDVVKEIGPVNGGFSLPAEAYEDDKKLKAVEAESNISLFLNYHAFNIEKKGTEISKVYVRHIETGKELSFSAPLFADCTGDGTIGFLAGADFSMGRESKAEFSESLAPETADKMTMGSSVQWYSVEENESKYFKDETGGTPFPIFQYGIKFNEENCQKVKSGPWYWETGMNLDQINDFERIRDYGMLVIYSNWSFLKNYSKTKEEYRKSRLNWVAYVAGKRESRRLLGDLIMTEQDLIDSVIYPDASVTTSWSIDQHFPDPKNTENFPGKEFIAISKALSHTIYYPIPYRCLYSRNVSNLFMAGRDISVTHIALGAVRVMRTTGMMGEVVGMAAFVAIMNKTTPRDVYQNHLEELKTLMKKGIGKEGTYPLQDYHWSHY
jgi:hypothetical protein